MPTITANLHIAAPIEEVFAQATDFPAAASRIDGIVRVEMLTDGPVGHGTRWRETRILFGREASEQLEVTRFQPPDHYTLRARNHGTEYERSFRSVERNGGTDVELTFRATPVTVGARIASFLTRPLVKQALRGCARDLEQLKRSIEGGT